MTQPKFDELRLSLIMMNLITTYLDLRTKGITPEEWYTVLSLVLKIMRQTHKSMNFAQLDRRAEDDFKEIEDMIRRGFKEV